MKFYGDIDLNDNQLQQIVIANELDFPVAAPVGTIVFKDKRLYMCVALNIADPIWIPVSDTINTYTHDQTTSSTSWSISHNLNSNYVIVQVYDDNHKLIIADSIALINANTITINFSNSITGRAVVLFGDTIPANGVGIIG